MKTLLIFSDIIMLTYLLCILIRFKGRLSSISNSWYLYEDAKKNLGEVFFAWAILSALTMLPVLIEFAPPNYQFLAFLCATALGFVGAAPRFKSYEKTIHFTTAIICMLSGTLYVIFCTPYLYLLLLHIISAYYIYKKKGNSMLIIELIAIVVLYISVNMSVI